MLIISAIFQDAEQAIATMNGESEIYCIGNILKKIFILTHFLYR